MSYRWRLLSPEGDDGGDKPASDPQPIEAFLPADWEASQRADYARRFGGDEGIQKALVDGHEQRRAFSSRVTAQGKVPKEHSEYTLSTKDDRVSVLMEGLRERAHKTQMGQDQFSAVEAAVASDMKAQGEKIQEMAKSSKARFEREAKAKYGDDYSKRMAKAEEFIASLPEDSQELLEVIGADARHVFHELCFAAGDAMGDGEIPGHTSKPKEPSMTETEANFALNAGIKKMGELEKAGSTHEKEYADVMKEVDGYGRVLARFEEKKGK